MTSTAAQFLDRVHSVAALEALEADPARHATLLADELPALVMLPEGDTHAIGAVHTDALQVVLEVTDATLSSALIQIDAFASRVMRFLLDHALADDASLGEPTRKVFAATIVGYATDLGTLADRARDVAARGRSPDPGRVADLVVTAAQRALAVRAMLRDDALALVRDRATATLPDADLRARDRKLDDATRMKWSAIRRDLETLIAAPEHVAFPRVQRLAALPPQLDEPMPEPEVSPADLIELD